jgi:sulfite reductase (ferredoxin)
LRAVAKLADELAGGRVRTTTQQKLVILDVPEKNLARLETELTAMDLPVNASTWRRNTMACTGIEFCKLAIVETKGRAAELYAYLERKLPGFDEEVRINVNGCPNSCARYQTADIGLMGCLNTSTVYVTDRDGKQRAEKIKTEAFLVHLGGHLGEGLAFGKKVRGVKVPASELGPYVETLILRYRARRNGHQSFAAFISGLDDEQLKEFGSKPSIPGAPPAPAIIAEPRV